MNIKVFSVIIPTMWRSNKTEKLLKDLNASKYVSEIILIDNDTKSKNIDLNKLHKIKYYPQPENIYVNPAWNLGVELASNDLLCICNDDINFEVDKHFEFVTQHTDKMGLFGANIRPFRKIEKDLLYKINDIRITKAALATQGYGMLMFTSKNKWVNIPDTLKIWFGDDWMANEHKDNLYSLHFVDGIDADKHTTVSSKELSQIIKDDKLAWKELDIYHKGPKM